MGKGKREWGGKGGGSVYSQPGIRVDGNSRQDTEEGFQVSKRGVQGIRVLEIPKQKGIIERIGACTSVFHANHVCEMQDTPVSFHGPSGVVATTNCSATTRMDPRN